MPDFIKKISSFFLSLTPITFILCISCASNQAALHAPKLVVVVSTPETEPAPTVSDQPDSCAAAGESSPGDIDSLIDIAQSACENADYESAHVFLREAAQAVKSNQGDFDDNTTEGYYKKIANCYTESMPAEYEDSIPDEISMLAFRKQLSRTLDAGKFSPSDSAMWKKNLDQKKTSFDIPIVWNDRVYKALYFLNRGGKGSLDKWIARAAYYMPTIKKMFVDSGMPADLAYLPLIESGFNPLAYSRMHASGMWQFIQSTGVRYGLLTDCWVDERRDFIKSTRAAITYFKKLYDQFNDWHLAIGSYNCGENGMSYALGRSRVKDYWSLSLPRETMHYVPEFIATLIAVKNHTPPDSENAQTLDTFNLDTVTVKECLSLYAIADTLHIASDALRRMNPHVTHWCTHPRLPVTLYLPHGTRDRFLIAYDQSPMDFLVAWYAYKVKSGDNFFGVSRRFKIPMEALLSLNSRSSSQRLSVGQEILIPIPTNQAAYRNTAIRVKSQPVKASYKAVVIKGSKVIKYRVRPGDRLQTLAQLFHVDKNDLCGWNGLADETGLRSGMMLSIYKSLSMHNVMYNAGSSASRTVSGATKADQKTPAMNAPQKSAAIIADASSKRIVYYRIRKGDNLWNIAQSFRVAIRQLTSINDITPDTALLPGKVIKVPLLEEL